MSLTLDNGNRVAALTWLQLANAKRPFV